MGILETEILIDSYNATLIHNQAVIEGLRGAGAKANAFYQKTTKSYLIMENPKSCCILNS